MPRRNRSDQHRRPRIEWIVGCVSAILVAVLMGHLANEALFGDTRPPDLHAIVERREAVEGGTLLIVAISNRGDRAAAEVAVEAVKVDGSHSVRREIRFDYVAARSVRRGAFLLEDGSDDDLTELRLHVQGYVEP